MGGGGWGEGGGEGEGGGFRKKKPSEEETAGYDWEKRDDRKTLQRFHPDQKWGSLFPTHPNLPPGNKFGSRKPKGDVLCSFFLWTFCQVCL